MKIIKSYLNQKSWGNSGNCYVPREKETIIDTIIIHSAFLSNEMLSPSKVLEDIDVKDELSKLFSFLNQEKVTLEKLNETTNKIDNLLGIALKDKFTKNNVTDHYSVDGIKILFEYLGVSAHYVIGRDGSVFELVNPKDKAFHAGRSCLPNTSKEGVNEFSIGIEILSCANEDIVDIQYQALKNLVLELTKSYPISNLYGHSDIAIPKGRKIDPTRFEWKHFMELLNPNISKQLNNPTS